MRRLTFVLLMMAAIAAAGQDGSADSPSLGDIARQTRKTHEANAASGRVSRSFELSSPEEAAEKVRDLLDQRKFQELELAAERARSSRRQLPGGIWQLADFYDTVSKPLNKKPTEAEWQAQRNTLADWDNAIPGSFTAKIALAQLHVDWGWSARGNGYADTVTEPGWKGFGDHLETAMRYLNDPSVASSNCPYKYDVAMQLALGAGLDKPRMEALFRKAITAEPDYYHYYRYYANYLQEKWYGAPGEAIAFAERSAREVGGEKGDFIYFEIATVLGCDCADGSDLPKMSWQRIKAGYAALESLYGTSTLKRNRMAFLAVKINDPRTARKMFDEIGENWEPAVWRSVSRFQSARGAVMLATQNTAVLAP